MQAIYRSLFRIRRLEEEIIRIYPSDKVKSPVHLSIGQEAVSVGVCESLRPEDVVFGTYRGHALYLAKGGNLNAMMAELFGKQGGSSSGKAGSMHLADFSAGMMGTSAIVATNMPLAVGYAMAAKMRRRDSIVVVFFGEGAMDEGVFHESVNFASLKKLPILFVCENNLYAIYSHVQERMPEVNLCTRVESYNIPAERVENGDIFAIIERSKAAIGDIRAGGGPRFLECETYRWRDHVGPDEDRIWKYRPDAELDGWIARDEVALIGAMLDDDVRKGVEAEVEAEIAEAIEFAANSPFPADLEINNHVFSE